MSVSARNQVIEIPLDFSRHTIAVRVGDAFIRGIKQ
jgi:hypothetical protein